MFRIFKMAAVRNLGFVWGVFRPPTEIVLGGLYHCTQFGYDQYLGHLAGNRVCMPPKIGV